MQKRELSVQKLPRLPNSEGTLSSKLFSLTGLRIFKAKFIEDLKQPKPTSKLHLHAQEKSENMVTTVPPPTTGMFTGKDKINQVPPDPPTSIKVKPTPKTKVKCMRPRGLRNLGNTCFM